MNREPSVSLLGPRPFARHRWSELAVESAYTRLVDERLYPTQACS